MHVLGTPPAFTLSQDQTLHHEEFSPLSRDLRSHELVLSKGIWCYLMWPLWKRDHAPTEVVFHTFLFAFLTFSGTYFVTDLRPPPSAARQPPVSTTLRHLSADCERLCSAPLCSCSGAVLRTLDSSSQQAQKTPRATLANSGSVHNRLASKAVSPGVPAVRLLSCSSCEIVTRATADRSVQRRSL